MTRAVPLCFACLLGLLACEGTETGNPDLSRGDGGGHGHSTDGGSPPRGDAGWVPPPDAGVSFDAGVPPHTDGGPVADGGAMDAAGDFDAGSNDGGR